MINVELFFNFDPIYPLYKTIREWFAMSKNLPKFYQHPNIRYEKQHQFFLS